MLEPVRSAVLPCWRLQIFPKIPVRTATNRRFGVVEGRWIVVTWVSCVVEDKRCMYLYRLRILLSRHRISSTVIAVPFC